MTDTPPIQRPVLEQAFEAASPVRDGNAEMQLAQSREPIRLIILYPAWNGCGGANGPHNFANLRTANGIPGVQVQYAPISPGPITPRPEGIAARENPNDSVRLLTRYGLVITDSRAALIDARGNLIGRYETNSPEFLTAVRRYAAPRQSASMDAGRSNGRSVA